MSDEQVYIVSDLHLGSEFFHRELFLAWFHGLPPGSRLILNGDIVDEPEEPLHEADAQVLRELVAAAAEQAGGYRLVLGRAKHLCAVVIHLRGRRRHQVVRVAPLLFHVPSQHGAGHGETARHGGGRVRDLQMGMRPRRVPGPARRPGGCRGCSTRLRRR